MQTFVNPLPGASIGHFLQFDFPADAQGQASYAPVGSQPNINIEPPGVEAVYGQLGTPAREQGHPFIREVAPGEPEDPTIAPYLDQVVDMDRDIEICHTGRLSGSFVKYLTRCNGYESRVKAYAHPVTSNAAVVPLGTQVTPLVAGAAAPNSWYVYGAGAEQVQTVKFVVNPKAAGLQAETVYKLVLKWEFWDTAKSERMPISGFDEHVGFEVSSATVNM